MKIEPTKLSKIIEQNYSFFAPIFYEMQTDYLYSMNNVYKDLDSSLILMLLTKKIYQVAFDKENEIVNRLSVKSFYKEKNYTLEASKFKINEISRTLNLPRETVRRKKLKLIKNKFVLFNKKKKIYSLNSEKIDEKFINTQIEISNKLLYNYCVFFSQKKNLLNEINFDSFKNEINKKFITYLPIFLNFQIYYFANMRKILDMECLFINLICGLNTTSHLKKINSEDHKFYNLKDIFTQFPKMEKSFGLNSTSIADITNIPRTTVLRKLAKLEKLSLLKRDKFKRYATQGLANSSIGKKEYFPQLQYTIKLLGIFISECLETYFSKEMKIT
jgi:predicted transcriptional regulator